MSPFDAAGFEPSPLGHVRVGDIDVGWREIGTGSPLLMITGFAATMAEWDPALVAGLSARHRVIVFDNRGMGTSSDVPGNEMTIEQLAGDAAGFLDVLGIERAHVLGWSMGGEIGQTLAINHPEKLDHLVLASTDPGSPRAVPPSDPAARAVLEKVNPDVDELMPLIFPPGHEQDAQGYMERIFAWPDLDDQSFTVTDDEAATQAQADHGPRWLGPGKGAYDRLGEVGAPTLVAAGEADLLEPPENAGSSPGGSRTPR